jgi:hypothetical protein
LDRRNEYLIESNHPLKETVILQTGKTKLVRHRFLEKAFNDALAFLINVWNPETKGDPNF